jgi:formylglycine-generating enzyme required for sulfatase activity
LSPVSIAARPRLAGLKVDVEDQSGNALEATISVDGKKLGPAPGPYKLSVCSKKVEVVAEGGGRWSKTLKLAEKQVSSLKAVVGSSRRAGTGAGAAGMDFVRIPAGSFTMGCTAGQSDCGSDEKPAHSVRLSNDFLMGKTEVTQGQWKALMGSNPSNFSSCGTNCPVEKVSWWDTLKFANKVSAAEGLAACYSISGSSSVTINSRSGKVTDCEGYRLPTEAEWEYAARGGQDLRYSGSNGVGNVAWYRDNSSKKTHPVATKQPNAWGLYDMSGNVWEWTWDWYDSSYYSDSSGTDPEGPRSGSKRVLRGSSCVNHASDTRVANRISSGPGLRDYNLGFRLSRTIP